MGYFCPPKKLIEIEDLGAELIEFLEWRGVGKIKFILFSKTLDSNKNKITFALPFRNGVQNGTLEWEKIKDFCCRLRLVSKRRKR